MSTTLLRLDSVEKRFGGLRAVDGVDLEVREGSICALIGPNGSGKTTTFNIIAGALTPDSGSVQWRGEDVTGRRPHEIAERGIARTFQLTRSFERMTVRENVVVGALRTASGVAQAGERADEVIAWADLEDQREELAQSLPVAARKRLELARAAAAQPRLLLLDEVLAGLRPFEIDAMLTSLLDLRERGTTLLIVEHIMRVVMQLSEWVYVLDHGRLISQGTPTSVAGDPEVIRAYLGDADAGSGR